MAELPTPAPIPPHLLARVDAVLGDVDAKLARYYPGDRPDPQPVHTAYVSAAEATADTPQQWGASAQALLERHPEVFAGLDEAGVLESVHRVLGATPVADLRIDFEDGYGYRGDDVEDADAVRAGRILAGLDSLSSKGIRIKGLTSAERTRAVRTLELVLEGAGGVPAGFVFTVPKLRMAQQVEAAVLVCQALETAHGLPERTLRFELQIESPQAIIGPDGATTLAAAIHHSDRRCTGLHYGTYDYSAACGIAPQFQSLEHPVADHAKAVMLAAAAQTGVWVCDGSTQVLPVGSDDEVSTAIERHHRLVTRSLERGYYQGWDMHPGHLATRWLACFGFYRRALAAAAPRIDRYLGRLGGSVVDEPATAQALATVVLRGLDAGAYSEADITALAPAAGVSVLRQLRIREEPSI